MMITSHITYYRHVIIMACQAIAFDNGSSRLTKTRMVAIYTCWVNLVIWHCQPAWLPMRITACFVLIVVGCLHFIAFQIASSQRMVQFDLPQPAYKFRKQRWKQYRSRVLCSQRSNRKPNGRPVRK